MQVPTLQQFEVLQQQVALLLKEVTDLKASNSDKLLYTYHLGTKPTPGRGYDDRLVSRMGYCYTKLRELLVLGPVRGGLRHKRNGNKYVVTEAAVLEYFREHPDTRTK